MFAAAKDKMTSQAAKAYLNNLLRSCGHVDMLSIDSKCRRIELLCTLDGEVDAIGVCIEKYEIEQKDGNSFVRVIECSATRRWLQAAMRDHLIGRPVELPTWVAAAL